MFGPHLILEAYGCPKDKLADLGLVSQALDAYPAQLDMTKIMPPYVFRYQGTVEDDWGVPRSRPAVRAVAEQLADREASLNYLLDHLVTCCSRMPSGTVPVSNTTS